MLLSVVCRGDVFRDISVYFEQIQERKRWKASLRVERWSLSSMGAGSLISISYSTTDPKTQQCLHVGEKVSLRHTFILKFKGHSKLNKYNTWYQAPWMLFHWAMKCHKMIWKNVFLRLEVSSQSLRSSENCIRIHEIRAKALQSFLKISILKRKCITSMILEQLSIFFLEQLSKTCIHVTGSIMVP